MDRALVSLVWDRARSRCEYCQLAQKDDIISFEIDHVIAVSHHGPTRPNNLALACFLDNSYKGTNLSGIDPETGQVARLFNPRRHKWSRHFEWEGPVLQGKTAIGRATVATLRINLPNRVAHRAALTAEGVFPP
jgi:HNH endonuclease